MDDQTAKIYAGRPLLNSKDIRVLDIKFAANFEAPVECSLEVISLDDTNASYQTLSYAWGSLSDTKTITCDSMSLSVTSDMDIALRRIREKQVAGRLYSRSLWIDAICINQQDDKEKNSQVFMMGEIYRISRHLIIWLGEGMDDEIVGIETAMQSPHRFQSVPKLISVAHRPWFKRRWIIQEVIKSPRSYRHFLLGTLVIDFWSLFTSFWQLYEQHKRTRMVLDTIPLFTCSYSKSQKHSKVYSTLQEPMLPSSRPMLLENLLLFQNARTSFDHDHIYALLSISRDGDKIPIGYRSSLESIYTEVAKQYLGSDVRLAALLLCATVTSNFKEILKQNATFYGADSRLAVPSWVPDWQAADAQFRYDSSIMSRLSADVSKIIQPYGLIHTVEIEVDKLNYLRLECWALHIVAGTIEPHRQTSDSCQSCIKANRVIDDWPSGPKYVETPEWKIYVLCITSRALIVARTFKEDEHYRRATLLSYHNPGPEELNPCHDHERRHRFCIV